MGKVLAWFRTVVAKIVSGIDLASSDEGKWAGFDYGLDVRGVREREEGTCLGFQWVTQDTRAQAKGGGGGRRPWQVSHWIEDLH